MTESLTADEKALQAWLAGNERRYLATFQKVLDDRDRLRRELADIAPPAEAKDA